MGVGSLCVRPVPEALALLLADAIGLSRRRALIGHAALARYHLLLKAEKHTTWKNVWRR